MEVRNRWIMSMSSGALAAAGEVAKHLPFVFWKLVDAARPAAFDSTPLVCRVVTRMVVVICQPHRAVRDAERGFEAGLLARPSARSPTPAVNR